jgi:hypothetical protein
VQKAGVNSGCGCLGRFGEVVALGTREQALCRRICEKPKDSPMYLRTKYYGQPDPTPAGLRGNKSFFLSSPVG